MMPSRNGGVGGLCPIAKVQCSFGLLRFLEQHLPIRTRWQYCRLVADILCPRNDPMLKGELLFHAAALETHGGTRLVGNTRDSMLYWNTSSNAEQDYQRLHPMLCGL